MTDGHVYCRLSVSESCVSRSVVIVVTGSGGGGGGGNFRLTEMACGRLGLLVYTLSSPLLKGRARFLWSVCIGVELDLPSFGGTSAILPSPQGSPIDLFKRSW